MAEELGFSKGLAGVVADATSVSQVQGEVGRLIYRGISIEEIAEKSIGNDFVLATGKAKWAADFVENLFLKYGLTASNHIV
ncbi:hypothetical protein EBR21_13185, partial [bacterium]|nr:hypothetical protein [bacterium]